MKTIRIQLKDADQKTYVWTVKRLAKVFMIDPDGPGTRSRHGSGWEYTDHDGYRRFQEGTWIDVIPRIKLTAENYGLTLHSDLS